jgi:hypothetical protein
MKQGPEGPEFPPDNITIGYNGGGVSDKVDGSPSNSIAIGEKMHSGKFGYNDKDPVAIRHGHQREERNGR